MGHSLWVHRAAPFVDPGKFSRFSWNLLSNQSGKYFKVYRKTPWTCKQFSKNKGSKYFKVTWLPIQKKDFFQFWSFVECFEYLELQKFLAPGILSPSLDFISGLLPVYSRVQPQWKLYAMRTAQGSLTDTMRIWELWFGPFWLLLANYVSCWLYSGFEIYGWSVSDLSTAGP